MDQRDLSTTSILTNDGLFIKILVPAMCAGVVIGKAGKAISTAQRDSGTRVKISRQTDCFPGTSERVCLIQGNKKAIAEMINYISICISDKTDSNMFSKYLDRQRQTILVIPNSSAGFLIGKDGETINKIKEISGAFIRVSPLQNNREISERCVTVSGTHEQRTEAIKQILNKVIEDPKLCSIPNINYGDMSSSRYSGQSFSSYNNVPYNNYHFQYSANTGLHRNQFNRNYRDSPWASVNSKLNKNILSPDSLSEPLLSNVTLVEIAKALRILSTNGFLYSGNTKKDYHDQSYSTFTPNSQIQSPFKAQPSSFEELDHMANKSLNGITRTIELDDIYIGPIIGRNGKSIISLQELTNTTITVSKKPEKALDNLKRTITISGLYEDVSKAYLLIHDKIDIEKKRIAKTHVETDFGKDN